jgi:hypothetical protein
MKGVFADSSFWIALRDKRERYHSLAKTLASEMLEAKTTFVITVMIFAETHAYFSRELVLRERVIRDFWENPVIQIEPISHQDQVEAAGDDRGVRERDVRARGNPRRGALAGPSARLAWRSQALTAALAKVCGARYLAQ